MEWMICSGIGLVIVCLLVLMYCLCVVAGRTDDLLDKIENKNTWDDPRM